ncbi:MAG: helix-turn-helix domain-containing protein [Acetobacteraceae bacterium]|nr:helix-turn-helix domain-containing protein [Acetobacteraceae bacterium]
MTAPHDIENTASPADAPVAESNPPALLTPAETAALLRVNTRRLERWRATGEGPAFVKMTAKAILYRRSDIEAFIAAHLCTRAAS